MATKKNQALEHLYLIDGSGYIFRAYHALPPMQRSDGTPINAVLGFSNMLFKLLEDLNEGEKPTHLAVIFDHGRRTFRNDIYEEYKAHRPPPPEDLIPQFPLIRDATLAFGLPSIDMEGYEADDLIATYARLASERGWTTTIVSSDKDLMQLVDDQVDMFDSMKNKRVGLTEVIEKFGVGPDKVIEVQALAGDSSDNVPGVPGIGVKTAAQLISEYGDLETLLERAEEIKQPKRRENLMAHADLARISRDLVRLRQDVPIEQPLESLTLKPIPTEEVLRFADDMEFRSLKSKLTARLGQGIGDSEAPLEADPEERVYETVSDIERLKFWIKAATNKGTIAVDTETTSLNAMRAELVGVSLSLTPGAACYIPLRHRGPGGEGLDLDGEAPDQIPVKEALALLKPLLEDPSVLKVGQNIKYDLLVFKGEGIEVGPIDDTMAISYVLECGLHGHGMDELSLLHFGIKPISFKEVAGTGKAQVTFDRVPLETASEYAAEDADITLRLYRALKPRLAVEGLRTVYETLERPLIPVLADMEAAGVKVDRVTLARLSKEFSEGMEGLATEIHKLAGRDFNIASPKQLGEILFDEMGLKGGKKGKTGAYSTDASVLERLATEGHELPIRVLDWRLLAKLKSTYTDTLQKEINPDTGRVHTSYAIAATSTGRLASSDPNLQNIPIRTEEGRKIRQAFVAEKGNKLLAADYSQIELRLLAEIAEIDALREAFDQSLDIHAMTASEVFGVPIEGMDRQIRRQAKAINFGIIYGISAFGLANQLGISRTEAQEYMDRYFERFPGIRDYMEKTREEARSQGYVSTLFGRRCHIRGIKDRNPNMRNFAERAAINAPLQGSAADIIRRAMVRMPGALAEAGLGDVIMLMQVHDELIFELPKGQVEAASAVIKETMETAASPAVNISVPIVVDCDSGDNWNQAH
jgi:DNA polymerase-1